MDNIQKAILTVLGVAGMIAMLVPSENPIDPAPISSAEAEQAEQPSDSVDEALGDAPNIAPDSNSTDSIDETFKMGQPSIDGKPIQPDFGMPYGVSAVDTTQNPATNSPGDISQDTVVAPGTVITPQPAAAAAVNAD